MKRIKLLFLTIFLIIGSFSFNLEASPRFYLGTDKTFSESQTPYVTIEGYPYKNLLVRVYRISKPLDFITANVKKRAVAIKNKEVMANPFSLFRFSLENFKRDMRKVARAELTSGVRELFMKTIPVKFDKKENSSNFAQVKPLKKYQLLKSFFINKGIDGWNYKKITIPIKKNGVYLVEVVSGNDIAHTVVIKSPLTFITKQSSNQTFIYVAKGFNGNPIQGATVNILDGENGQFIARLQSNSMGIANISKKSKNKTIVVIEKNGNFAISDPNFYANSFYADGGNFVFLHTDRPVYRIGDVVNFSAIFRKFQNGKYHSTGGTAVCKLFSRKGKQIGDTFNLNIDSQIGTGEGSIKLTNDSNHHPLGIYNLVAFYNEENFSTEFSVKEYKKPPFEVKISKDKDVYDSGDSVKFNIVAKYYSGLPLSGKVSKVKIFRKKRFYYSPVGSIPFFMDANRYLGIKGGESELVFQKEINLNSKGEGTFSYKPSDIDGDYTYTVIALTQASHFSITGSTGFAVNRSKFYINLKRDSILYNPNSKARIRVQLIPFANGKIDHIKIKGELLKRGFVSISKEAPRKKISSFNGITNKKGEVNFTLDLPESGHYIVKFYAEDDNGEETESTSAFWVSQKDSAIQLSFKNITLKSSKDIYTVGDTADVLLMSPISGGTILVTLEGNDILKQSVLKLTGNSYRYNFQITDKMSPNCTLSAIQIWNGEVYKSSIKIVTPPIHKFLKLSINTDKKIYKPNERVNLSIKATNYKKQGRDAEVSIAVVDESIYQIASDRTPNIQDYFYHLRRNSINTTISTFYRFFGYARSEELKLALRRNQEIFGGLKGIRERGERTDFLDTAFWKGKIKLNSNGKGNLSFKLPGNITKWRITAFAVTKDSEVGEKRISIIARKKIMVSPTLPQYIYTDEKFTIPVTVANFTQKSLSSIVSISLKNGKILNKAQQSITIKPNKTKIVYFKIKGGNKNKNLHLKFKITSGNLKDICRYTIPLVTYGIKKSISKVAKLNSGDSKTLKLNLSKKFNNGKLTILAISGVSGAISQSLQYLVNYPYGCIEQTMSRFVPLVVLNKSGLIAGNNYKNINAMVDRGLRLIKGHQNYDGGFNWYGGNARGDTMMSAYIYMGLNRALKKGIAVDRKMLQRLKMFLFQKIATTKNKISLFEKAYILYSLSVGTNLPNSMLHKLTQTFNKQTLYGKGLTILALLNNKDRDRAEQLYKQIDEQKLITNNNDYFENTYAKTWKKDNIETAAVLLIASLRLNADNKKINWLKNYLLKTRDGIAWKNSRDTGMALFALGDLLKKQNEEISDISFKLKINGKETQNFQFSKDNLKQGIKLKLSVATLNPDKNIIKITNNSSIEIFYTVIASFFDMDSSMNSFNNGLTVRRKYYQLKGDIEKKSFKKYKTKNFTIGETILVEIKYTKKDDKGYLILKEPNINGFSVPKEQSLFMKIGQSMGYEKMSIYDSQILFFIPPGYGKNGTIRYILRAENEGWYKVLPSIMTDMYYSKTNGGSGDDKLKIKK